MHVAVRVVIRPKIRANLDGRPSPSVRFDLESHKERRTGRVSIEFGTVRPRVQIPGPRPNFECSSREADVSLFSRLARWASLNDGRTTALTLC